jgi:hypothetical protein
MVTVQRRCSGLRSRLWKTFRSKPNTIPGDDKNRSPPHGNGVRRQTGMLFGITAEWCSASHRNRVRLRPDSPEKPSVEGPLQMAYFIDESVRRTGGLCVPSSSACQTMIADSCGGAATLPDPVTSCSSLANAILNSAQSLASRLTLASALRRSRSASSSWERTRPGSVGNSSSLS